MSTTITKAVISPSDPKSGQYQASCTAQFSDGTSAVVLSWFDDELTFTEGEFIGLTQSEVNQLFMDKDKTYLQS